MARFRPSLFRNHFRILPDIDGESDYVLDLLLQPHGDYHKLMKPLSNVDMHSVLNSSRRNAVFSEHLEPLITEERTSVYPYKHIGSFAL